MTAPSRDDDLPVYPRRGSVRPEGLAPSPGRPLPDAVEEWQTRPERVRAWRHTGPFPIVAARTDGTDLEVEPGSWVTLTEGGWPIEVLDDDAFRARHEPRGRA